MIYNLKVHLLQFDASVVLLCQHIYVHTYIICVLNNCSNLNLYICTWINNILNRSCLIVYFVVVFLCFFYYSPYHAHSGESEKLMLRNSVPIRHFPTLSPLPAVFSRHSSWQSRVGWRRAALYIVTRARKLNNIFISLLW